MRAVTVTNGGALDERSNDYYGLEDIMEIDDSGSHREDELINALDGNDDAADGGTAERERLNTIGG